MLCLYILSFGKSFLLCAVFISALCLCAAEFQKVSEEGTGLEVWPFAPGFLKQTQFIPTINTEGEHM